MDGGPRHSSDGVRRYIVQARQTRSISWITCLLIGTFTFSAGNSAAQPLAKASKSTEVEARQSIGRNLKVASVEFQVPLPILQALALYQSHWTHSVPTGESDVPAAFGVMGLRDDEVFGHNVFDAAHLINEPAQTVKEDVAANIRGAASLLASYAAEERAHGIALTDKLETWRTVVERYSGIQDPQLAGEWAAEVFQIVHDGYSGAGIDIPSTPVDMQQFARSMPTEKPVSTVGYPQAIWKGTSYNYDPGRTAAISRIVIHTIVLNGTSWSAVSALNSFQTNGFAASAHYIVRQNGEVWQVVSDSDTAWHAGNYSYGSINNSNSIGIELEGNSDYGDITTWQTSALTTALTNLVSWLCSTYGVPKDRAHIVGHNQVQSPPTGATHECSVCKGPTYWGGCCAGKTDPGAWFNWTKLLADLGRSPSYQAVAAQSSCSVLVTPEAGAPTTTTIGAGQKFVAYDTIGAYRAIFLSGDEPDNPYATKTSALSREYHWDGFVPSSCVASTSGTQLDIIYDPSGYWNIRSGATQSASILARTTNGKRHVATGASQSGEGYTWYPFDLAWGGTAKTGWSAGAQPVGQQSSCTLTVTAPNGGETWTTGQEQTITWSSSGTACGANVKIELLKSGSLNSTITSSTANDGSFSWTPSTGLTAASDYSIRVTDTANSSYSDTSNSTFTIQAPASCTLTVTAPNGGETWTTGQQQTISWSSSGTACGANVKIELLKGGSLNSTITSSTANDGSFSWSPSTGLTAASDYSIRVTDTANSSYSDTSNSTFTIQAPSSCTLTVTAPNGGETWTTGQQQTITWSSNGTACGANVKIELLKGGSLNSTITSSTANNGSFSWTPSTGLTAASDYSIRVTDTANSSYSDTSNATFTLTASPTCAITVTAPNGGETWSKGQPQTITWSSSGTACGSNVAIDLLKGSSVYSAISGSTPNDGSFSWTPASSLPDGTDYKIRVSDASNASYSDSSNSAFTISGASVTMASYDATLKAPKCGAVTVLCDSGTLLVGRGPLGPEPNSPNTIGNSCSDGSEGAYHSDESIDRIVIQGNDGLALTSGRLAKVDIDIWAYGPGDHLDVYYTSNAASPLWTYFGSADITVAGAQTWELTYNLPQGALQALRVQLRWQGATSPCTTDIYNDHDDLIFAVQQASAQRVLGDFDGDGKADVGVFRPSTGFWYSNAFPPTSWGQSGDILVPGDYDGDGKMDIAVFRPSTGMWYSNAFAPTLWGQSGDIPVPADYDGDGKADIAVFRPSTGMWYSNAFAPTLWGQSGDIPVPADYDGDGKADIAVFRPSTGMWYSNAFAPTLWGQSGDIPVPADYDGDGKAHNAVFRPSTGMWYSNAFAPTLWGQNGDVPVTGDYDGDGKADIAVFRPSTGMWYSNAFTPTLWGQNGDIPVPADYNGDGKADIAVFRPSTGMWYSNAFAPMSWGTAGDFPLTTPVAMRHY